MGAIEAEDFTSDEMRQRYQTLVNEMRCPKCQNQNLAGSNSPISADLRGQIRRLLHEGASDEEIADYLVARYGDFVLYRPRWQPSTYALWFIPFALLAFAALVVFSVVRRRRAKASLSTDGLLLAEGSLSAEGSLLAKGSLPSEGSALSAAEQAELNQVLGTDRRTP